MQVFWPPDRSRNVGLLTIARADAEDRSAQGLSALSASGRLAGEGRAARLEELEQVSEPFGGQCIERRAQELGRRLDAIDDAAVAGGGLAQTVGSIDRDAAAGFGTALASSSVRLE